nr:MAG TPA: hypothetical protein [Bacteriophage sp.]
MLIKYEAELLKYFNTIVPEIVAMKYSEDTTELLAEGKNLQYPSVYYSRQTPEWTTSWQGKEITYKDEEHSVRATILPLKLDYKAEIMCSSHEQALNIMKEFRFNWMRNPYVYVNFPTQNDVVKVGLRLLYIKINTESMEASKQGPLRQVEVSWQSQLCILDAVTLPNVKGFEIRVINNKKEIIQIK